MVTFIDGEQIRVTTPRASLWTKSLETIVSENSVPKDKTRTILHVSNNFARAYLNNPDTGFSTIHPGWKAITAGWRPVLQIQEDPLLLSKDNPNGSISKGGTLYIDDSPFLLPEWKYYTMPDNPDLQPKTIFIGDTVPGMELSWIWYNEFCICTQIIIRNISLSQIRKYDLI